MVESVADIAELGEAEQQASGCIGVVVVDSWVAEAVELDLAWVETHIDQGLSSSSVAYG